MEKEQTTAVLPLTREEKLAKRVKELEAELDEEAEGHIDPAIIDKAKQFIQMSINDIKVAFEVVGITPTKEQQLEIENILVQTKAKAMAEKQERETLGKWGD